mmetsp:Transcript_16523/g.33651  ORF Transcript_16523/g.33651 Transcript_16523/m.33651 type:complete len:110 (-) Transcript_16523:295-624(-)
MFPILSNCFSLLPHANKGCVQKSDRQTKKKKREGRREHPCWFALLTLVSRQRNLREKGKKKSDRQAGPSVCLPVCVHLYAHLRDQFEGATGRSGGLRSPASPYGVLWSL